MKGFGTLLLTFWTVWAFAQSATLHGTVLDQATGERLLGVYVELAGADRVVATDASGKYVFDAVPVGQHTVRFSYIGKTTLEQTVTLTTAGSNLTVRLEEATYGLTAVVVRSEEEAALGLSRLRAVEGTAIYEGKKTEVVDLGRLNANLSANNPRQVFGRVAGLNIWESDGAGLQLGIGGRGLSPNRTSNFNTRQNGYDISADALGYPESYYTPPTEALQRIEVVRGAASLQYGTQFGGMLNFVFKKPPRNQAVALTTRQTLGSYGYFGSYTSAAGTVAKDKLAYFTFVQYKRGDGWRENAGFEMHNLYGSVQYRPTPKMQVEVAWTRMQYLAQQAGGLTDALFAQDARRSYRDRNWFDVDWNLLALTFDYRFSARTRLDSRLFRLDAARRSLGNLAPINVADLGGERDLIAGTFDNYGNETRLLHRYSLGGQENTFVVGFRLYRGQTTARQGSATDGRAATFAFMHPEDLEKSDYVFANDNAALFAEHIFRISPRWSITPGVRYEYIRTGAAGYYRQTIYDGAGNVVVANRFAEDSERSRQFVLAGLGTSYRLTPRWEAYANVSQNYRAINFSDLRIDNPNGRVDPAIRDERGYTADVGVRTQRGGAVYADVTAFYIAYRNRIGWVLRADEPPLYNDQRLRTNIADARNVGIEAFAEANLWQWLRPQDSLTRVALFTNLSVIDAGYINTDDRSIAGKQVELVPPLTVRAGLDVSHGAFRFGGSVAYTAEHYTDATNARRTASAVNGIIPAYTVVDLTASYRWRRFTLAASCNNLLDARYFTRRADAYPGPGIIPADGRAFFVTLGMEVF